MKISHCDTKEQQTTSATGPSATFNKQFKYKLKRDSSLILAVAFYISVLWNVSSPFKNWLLSRYGLLTNGNITTENILWSTPLDPVYLDGIYKYSGVARNRPNHTERFINVFMDFIVKQRSRRWAPYVNAYHDDEYVGRYCRTGLKVRRSDQLKELLKYSKTGITFWNGVNSRDYIIDSEDCAVGEVAEAMLCLKGITSIEFVHLEWKSPYNTSDSKVIEGLNAWQDKVMPDLNQCLVRRKHLIHAKGKKDGLLQLSEEMTKNYSLNLENVAGKGNLYHRFLGRAGFVDISGDSSGIRSVQLSGHLLTRSSDFDGNINALTVVREALWHCAFNKKPSESVKNCLLENSYSLPAYFVGQYITRPNNNRYLESQLYTPAGPRIDNVTEYKFVGKSTKLLQQQHLVESHYTTSVETKYNSVFLEYFDALRGKPAGSTKGWPKVCFLQNGCASACQSAQALRWNFIFKLSGKCVTTVIPSSLINNGGYVSKACLGEGTGNFFLFLQEKQSNLTIKKVADPSAILECVIGGRIPNGESIPNFFARLIQSGTSSVLLSVFSDGSEQIFLNFYSLIALAGYSCFAYWIICDSARMQLFLTESVAKIKSRVTKDQLFFGIYMTNPSTRVWSNYFIRLQIVGFVSILSWYLGASKTKCEWKVAPNSSISPLYECEPGLVFGHIASAGELVRQVSYSYVFHAMVYNRKQLIGISRTSKGYLLAIIFSGFIPCFISAIFISMINSIRFLVNLGWLHNQLVIATLWILAFAFWANVNSLWLKACIPLFEFLGEKRQKLKAGSKAQMIVGNFYWTVGNEYIDGEIDLIPLSVYLELPNSNIRKISVASHIILEDERPDSAPKLTPLPKWVEEANDFFIRL